MSLTGSEIEFLKKHHGSNGRFRAEFQRNELWIEPAMEIDPISQFLPLSVEKQDWV